MSMVAIAASINKTRLMWTQWTMKIKKNAYKPSVEVIFSLCSRWGVKKDMTKNWDRYCDRINFKLNKSHAMASNSLICTLKFCKSLCVQHSTFCISVFCSCCDIFSFFRFFFCYGNVLLVEHSFSLMVFS